MVKRESSIERKVKVFSDIRFENALWINELKSFREQLHIFERRLSKKIFDTEEDLAENLYHIKFDQFHTRIRKMISKINQHDHITEDAEKGETEDDRILIHQGLEKEMDEFLRDWKNLKTEFMNHLFFG